MVKTPTLHIPELTTKWGAQEILSSHRSSKVGLNNKQPSHNKHQLQDNVSERESSVCQRENPVSTGMQLTIGHQW